MNVTFQPSSADLFKVSEDMFVFEIFPYLDGAKKIKNLYGDEVEVLDPNLSKVCRLFFKLYFWYIDDKITKGNYTSNPFKKKEFIHLHVMFYEFSSQDMDIRFLVKIMDAFKLITPENILDKILMTAR